ncbi:MAG: 3,4-dihydroxy-2-butanone-4-phosphate synthase [Rhodospirillaceae bacterium]|nr:3,4-dihydroxy-2-butanone-4-phosphate synthase [Rhodospirillaceae bacterium]
MTTKLDRIEDAIAAIAAGHPVIVVDDEDRENEGDLIMAAGKATPEHVAFFIRHTSGILCTPLTRADARRLHLTPMVADNVAPHATAFTVSIDYAKDLTTGISAQERCACIRALANPNVGAEDFVRPGHIFPLIARDGGVLIRSGHTEAAVDMARLAGLPPVGLIAELVNDDGTVKRLPDIMTFAAEHKLLVVSIDELIAYRQQRESLITRVSEGEVATAIGPARAIVYSTAFDAAHHIAIVHGDIGDGEDIVIRLQQEEAVADVFDPEHGSVMRALKLIKAAGRGIVIYLREGAVGVQPAIRQAAGSEASRLEQWREIGLGAQILKDLGVKSIRVLATKERQYMGLSGFGVEILSTERL